MVLILGGGVFTGMLRTKRVTSCSTYPASLISPSCAFWDCPERFSAVAGVTIPWRRSSAVWCDHRATSWRRPDLTRRPACTCRRPRPILRSLRFHTLRSPTCNKQDDITRLKFLYAGKKESNAVCVVLKVILRLISFDWDVFIPTFGLFYQI